MIDFKEELKKFEPIKTLEEVGDTVDKDQDKSDIIEILEFLTKNK